MPDAFSLHPQLATDCHVLGEFDLCLLLHLDDIHYPWCILVPKRDAIREIYELNPADQALLWQESALLGRAMMRAFKGHKLNVAALGNQVPQLHLHHVVRQPDDIAWPKPVWGVAPTQRHTPDQRRAFVGQLLPLLGKDFSPAKLDF